MGAHIVNGQFQSDKYPTCPPGKVPLSVTDESAQDLLWQYAQRRRAVDAEFADDLEAALRTAGFVPVPERTPWGVFCLQTQRWWPRSFATQGEALVHLARCAGPGTKAEVRLRIATKGGGGRG